MRTMPGLRTLQAETWRRQDYSAEDVECMSLKNLRAEATSGPSIQCPSCGQSMKLKQVPFHHVKCPGWQKAKEDSANPHRRSQEELVTLKMSLSERYANIVLDSPWVRHHWFPSLIAIGLLAFLVGWVQPQGANLVVNVILIPTVILGALVAVV